VFNINIVIVRSCRNLISLYSSLSLNLFIIICDFHFRNILDNICTLQNVYYTDTGVGHYTDLKE